MTKASYFTMHQDYVDRATDASSMRDNDNCVVVALSLVLGIDYLEAWELASKYGRKHRQYWYLEVLLAILYSRGIRSRRQWRLRKPGTPKGRLRKTRGRYTSKTIGKRLPKGTWVVAYCDHVAILRDGELLDWSIGTNKRVDFVQRLVRLT